MHALAPQMATATLALLPAPALHRAFARLAWLDEVMSRLAGVAMGRELPVSRRVQGADDEPASESLEIDAAGAVHTSSSTREYPRKRI